MQVCIVYDCLYPYTVGGAERWYRSLAVRLAEEGHEVTYLTMRQWAAKKPDLPGVRVLAVAPRMPVYKAADGESCRRSSSGSASAGISIRIRPTTTTSSTRRRSRTSRCWWRPPCGGSPGTASSSTGTSSGRGTTGGSTSARSAAGSAGGCSGSVCACRSGRSASRGSSSGGCSPTESTARSPFSRDSSRGRRPRRHCRPSRSSSSPAGTSGEESRDGGGRDRQGARDDP